MNRVRYGQATSGGLVELDDKVESLMTELEDTSTNTSEQLEMVASELVSSRMRTPSATFCFCWVTSLHTAE